MTDALKTDGPDAADDDAADDPNYTENYAEPEDSKTPNIHRGNASNISKITTTQKKIKKTQKNITDVPDGDANYFLTMMLLMTPILLMMILAPQNPKKPHIH